MPLLKNRHPAYRLHKGTGRAVVTLNGKDLYLGTYGTPESRAMYDRTISEWIARGKAPAKSAAGDVSIVEIIDAFLNHAEGYYRKPDGTPTSEVGNFRDALRPLNRLYGTTRAVDFGPLALQSVREEMIRMGWCRGTVNKNVRRIRAVFKWAAGDEILPASIYQSLEAVTGLKRGRSDARESAGVQAVAESFVRGVLPFTSPQVRAVIELQLITGMRPGEALSMRGCDIDTAGPLWVYKPAQHKTQHHGHDRTIPLGPKAQAILKPFLTTVHGFLFSPAEAEATRRQAAHDERKTPLSCGNTPGSNVKANPKKTPGERYSIESFCKAIHGACKRAFPIPSELEPAEHDTAEQLETKSAARVAWRKSHRFHPNQLRHTAATNLRREFGLEAAQVILGHKTLTVTQVYAEKNIEAARNIMAKVG